MKTLVSAVLMQACRRLTVFMPRYEDYFSAFVRFMKINMSSIKYLSCLSTFYKNISGLKFFAMSDMSEIICKEKYDEWNENKILIVVRISIRNKNTIQGSCSEPTALRVNQRAHTEMQVTASTWNHSAGENIACRPAMMA